MKVVAGLALLLLNVRLSHSCYGEGQILFCLNAPQAFRPGYSSLVMILKDVGQINSTVFRSDHLTSVTRLRIEDAGITGIAAGAFSSFQQLTRLSLDQNLLTEMNPNWFGRPDILRELSLTQNHLEAVNEVMLSGLVNLTTLSLNRNRIRTIDPNSFGSQTGLAELDLSENRMTRVSPRVFGSLGSTRIRLDGNPWDCSCGAADFTDFVKDLHSRSLLDRHAEVTCESPPSLRGRPVWNVTACETAPPPRPPSVTQDVLTGAPPSAATSETSVQPKPPDAPLTISSVTDLLTAVTTPALKTATVTASPSPPSVTQTSVHPKPSDPPTTVSRATEITVVLAVAMFVVCLLVVLCMKIRNNKTVTPGCPRENRNKPKEENREERRNRDPEMGWKRPFTGVRAKSANAVLLTSRFCAPVKDRVTLQTEAEAQPEDTENQADGKQKVGGDTEGDGGFEAENLTNTTDVTAKQAADGRDQHTDPHTDAVLYLSIGTHHNQPDDVHKQSTDSPGQRSQAGKVMGRVSTWPPTAAQWKERCKMVVKEEEEEGSDVFTVWTPTLPGEVNKVERPSGPDQDKKDDQTEDSLKMNRAHMNPGHCQSSEPPNDETTSSSEAHAHTDMKQEEQVIQDPAGVSPAICETQHLDQEKLGQNQDLNPAEKITNESGSKAEPKRAVTSRQRPEKRSSTGSKAPSGGASPDDETLLSGNEYAFVDLLHEVVQNNGRWTRERWRQIHVNKQRR